MPKIYEIKINKFDGGIADSSREPNLTKCAMVKHFDIFNDPFKLVPNRSSVLDTIDTSTLAVADIRNFLMASTGVVYGMAKNSSGHTEIASKASPQTTQWTLNDIGFTVARVTGCFIEWQSAAATPALWMFGGTNRVFQVTIPGLAATDKLTLGETIVTVAQGILGGDNNLYMPYNNKIVRVSAAGVATDNIGPSLPSDMRITSLALWNNFIAIGMASGATATAIPTGPSKVFLWDKVSTTTVSEVIDWGEGALIVLGNVEGRLVGVTDKYLSDASGIGRGSMVIRVWNGGSASIVKEIIANQTVTLGRFLLDKVEKNNKLYWVASLPFNQSTATESTFHLGIWSYGRKNVDSNFALSLDIIEESIDAANYRIVSFGSAGNYFFINHGASGVVSRTDDADTYDFDSIYETQILNGGDGSKKKKLIGVTVFTEPLPAAGSYTLKYRIDAETSYTTIFTHSTDDSLSHSAVNIESSGATLPEFKEIQFRLESTGKAQITGLKCRYEETEKDAY